MAGIEPHPPAALKLGLQGATAVVRALGPVRYPLADGFGMVGYAVSGARRRNAALNHRRLEPGISMREARRRARRSFREFARNGVDFVWACGMDVPAVERHSVVVGRTREDTQAARDAGGGGVLALTHFGNWDMAANIAFTLGLPLTTVMATTGPRAITDLVVWARRQNQLEVYEAEHAAFGLVRAVRRGRLIAMLSDVPESGPTVVVDYCGGPVPFSAVPAWLALRTGAPLFPTACWREPDGKYHIWAMPPLRARPGDDERSLMQQVAARVEPLVRRHPGQWFPFRSVYADDAAAEVAAVSAG